MTSYLTPSQLSALRFLALYGEHGVQARNVTSDDIGKITWKSLVVRKLAEEVRTVEVVPYAPGKNMFFARTLWRLTEEGAVECTYARISVAWGAHDRDYILNTLARIVRLCAAVAGQVRPEVWVHPYLEPHQAHAEYAVLRRRYNEHPSRDSLYAWVLSVAVDCAGLVMKDIPRAFAALDDIRTHVRRELAEPHRASCFEGIGGGYVCREELGWPYAELETAPLLTPGTRPCFRQDPEALALAT